MSYKVSNNFLRHVVTFGIDDDDVRAALYTNNVNPADTSVIADFDLESGGKLDDIRVGTPQITGAEAKQLYRLTIGVSGVSGAKTIYGIVVYSSDRNSSKLFYAHRFASPIVISSGSSRNVIVDIERIFRQV